MDNRAIGVFDSGLGGLTAVKELHRVLPDEKIIYFGDTGRVPYGTRSHETIIKYAKQDIRFLEKFNTKAILVACGTVSAVALPEIVSDYDFPLRGVIDSTAKAAAEATKNGRIGIIATTASIESGAYDRALLKLNPTLSIFGKPAPLLVPLVENGRFGKEDPVSKMVLTEYLSPLLSENIDTLILGCTHYPLLTDLITSLCPGVTLINSGFEAAHAVASLLEKQDALCSECLGTLDCYVTDDAKGFTKNAGIFLGRPLDRPASLIDIGQY